MATCTDIEFDGTTLVAIVEDVTGLEVQVTVKFEHDPGQPLRFPSRSDLIGQEGISASVEITGTFIYVGIVYGEDDFVKVTLDKKQLDEIADAILNYNSN